MGPAPRIFPDEEGNVHIICSLPQLTQIEMALRLQHETITAICTIPPAYEKIIKRFGGEMVIEAWSAFLEEGEIVLGAIHDFVFWVSRNLS